MTIEDHIAYNAYWEARTNKVHEMLEYTPVNPLKLHPGTHGLIYRDYLTLKDVYPRCNPIHQIYNTIRHFAPDLSAAIASIQQSTKRLLADMQAYPDEAWKMEQELPYIAEFFERVQETSARLHNQEPAHRKLIEEINAAHAKSLEQEEEDRQRWLAEENAGDAYFGGPGSYAQIREQYFAELDMAKREALRQRIRAFQHAYYQDQQIEQCEPVQIELWEAIA